MGLGSGLGLGLASPNPHPDPSQVGNAPAAHLGELFVWRFQHVKGEVAPPAGAHAWLTKQELAERIGGPLGALALQLCDTLP